MKKTALVMAFVLFMSCVTIEKEPEYWEQYLVDKQKYIGEIEASIASPSPIPNINGYLLIIDRDYGYTNYERNSVYYDDFYETVYKKYKPILDARNEELDRQWIELSMKKIPGSRDWMVFQSRYNLKQIYLGMTHETNGVNRLRLEMVMKEMSGYIEDKNLVFNEEQKAWYDNVMKGLINIAFMLNVNFGMSDEQFQRSLALSLYKFDQYRE